MKKKLRGNDCSERIMSVGCGILLKVALSQKILKNFFVAKINIPMKPCPSSH
jgi:hypothetical protein